MTCMCQRARSLLHTLRSPSPSLPSACFATLQRLTLRVPRAVVFDEVGRAAMGPLGSGLVYGTIYLTILCEPIIFHLTCMETLRQVRLECTVAVIAVHIATCAGCAWTPAEQQCRAGGLHA